MADTNDVARIALALPGVVASETAYEIKEKGFVWYYQERVAKGEPRVTRFDVLIVRVANNEEKAILLASEPDKFFTIPHYNGYPAVHVRLEKVDEDELEELLIDAWRTRAPRKLLKEFESSERAEPH